MGRARSRRRWQWSGGRPIGREVEGWREEEASDRTPTGDGPGSRVAVCGRGRLRPSRRTLEVRQPAHLRAVCLPGRLSVTGQTVVERPVRLHDGRVEMAAGLVVVGWTERRRGQPIRTGREAERRDETRRDKTRRDEKRSEEKRRGKECLIM